MFGQEIIKLRQNLGLSCYELAKRSGHPVSTINGIEKGRNKNPHFQIVCDIATALGVTMDFMRDIFEGKEVEMVKGKIVLVLSENEQYELLRSLTSHQKVLARYRKRVPNSADKVTEQDKLHNSIKNQLLCNGEGIVVDGDELVVIHKSLTASYKRLVAEMRRSEEKRPTSEQRLQVYFSLADKLQHINSRFQLFDER